jgi:hypothetical protein
MARRNQHVVPHPGGWAVRPAGGSRPSSVHPTQQAAADRARAIAQHQRTEVVTHGRNGRIRDRDSYGNDPCPPRDRKH